MSLSIYLLNLDIILFVQLFVQTKHKTSIVPKVKKKTLRIYTKIYNVTSLAMTFQLILIR